jgi:hypothetical protein
MVPDLYLVYSNMTCLIMNIFEPIISFVLSFKWITDVIYCEYWMISLDLFLYIALFMRIFDFWDG